MDTTELHYVSYDPEQIWESMQDAYMDAGGDVLYPGDEKEILLRAVQALLVQLFASVDNALRQATLRYAQGDFLDMYGEKHNCERIQATPAHATVEIKLGATGTQTTIPEGSALTADGLVIYLLDEPINHNGSAITIDAGITCQDSGSVGNGLTEGTILRFVVSQPAVENVKVKTRATGGMNAEDDETYRARIHDWGMGIVTTGPSASYESKAVAAASEVLDARALQEDAGKVGLYLLLSDGASEENVKKTVLEAVNPRDIRPLTDKVNAYVVEKVEYDLTAQYQLEAGALASAESLTAAADEYKEWQNYTIGRAFNPDKLVAELYTAGASRVIIKPESTFNGGNTIQYTEIEPTQRCYGTVTLEVLS